MRLHLGLILSISCLAPTASAAVDWDTVNPIYTHAATTDAEFNRFGVTLDGDMAAVRVEEQCPILPRPGLSARCYEIMLLERQGNDWVQVARLRPSNGAQAPSDFGSTVAVSADLVVVTGMNCHDLTTDCRALYVYARPAGGWVNATETARIAPANMSVLELGALGLTAQGGVIVTGARSFGCDFVCGLYRPLVIGPGASGWSTPVAVALLQPAPSHAGGYSASDTLRSDGITVAFGIGHDIHIWERSGPTWTAVAPSAVISNVNNTSLFAVDDGAVAAPNSSGGVDLWLRGAGWSDRSAPSLQLSPSPSAPAGADVIVMDNGHIVLGQNDGDLVRYSQVSGAWQAGPESTYLLAAEFPNSEKPRYYFGVAPDGSVVAYNDRQCSAGFLSKACLSAWWLTASTDTPRTEVWTQPYPEQVMEPGTTGNLLFSFGNDSAADLDAGTVVFRATIGAGELTGGATVLIGPPALACTASAVEVECTADSLGRGQSITISVPWTAPATSQFVTITSTVTHAEVDQSPATDDMSGGLWIDRAPVVTGLQYTVPEWQSITGRVVVTDPDGDPVTLQSLFSGMGSFTLNTTTGDFTYIPPSNGFGVFPVDSPLVRYTDHFGQTRNVNLQFTFTPQPRNGGGGGGATGLGLLFGMMVLLVCRRRELLARTAV
jgi:hypothetical protein